jgi:hypothetical protein
MQTLATLDLCWNRIFDEGGQHICNALKSNTVRTLIFSPSTNRFFFFSTQVITTVDIRWNGAGEEILHNLGLALRRNRAKQARYRVVAPGCLYADPMFEFAQFVE